MKKDQELLKDAANEIRSLRVQNELMGARLEMFDNIMLLLRTPINYQGQVMSEDLVWKIERHLAESDKNIAGSN